VRLSTPFVGQRREGRRCCGGETVGGEWSSSMLPFMGEEKNGQCPFRKGRGACGAALGSHAEDAAARQWPTTTGNQTRSTEEHSSITDDIDYIPWLTDEATEEYNANEYMSLYLSVPMNIKVYFSVTCNRWIYWNIFLG
jgi:hypothetical protein